MILARIIKDSLSPGEVRLTTFVLTYPRFFHSEFLTHRMFSRNASSSRAIPVSKQIQMIKDNPVIPLKFLENKKGMQGGDPIANQQEATDVWLNGRDKAVEIANQLMQMNVSKQYVNRILEPWAHITVICSATDYNNFFALRVHPDAQPEICELATKMHNLYSANQPDILLEGEWHLPFLTKREVEHVNQNPLIMDKDKTLIKMSVARCARVSYLTHEGKVPSLKEDLELYDRLLGKIPIHASPAEHQARALNDSNFKSGNFTGWEQYRKTLPNENITNFKEIK